MTPFNFYYTCVSNVHQKGYGPDFDFLPLLHGSMLKRQDDIALAIDGTISEVQAGKITLCLSHVNDIKRYIAQIEATAIRLLLLTPVL